MIFLVGIFYDSLNMYNFIYMGKINYPGNKLFPENYKKEQKGYMRF
jgi:hypothetical protein